MANDYKELTKFCNDPKYREKVIARVHKDMDKEYNQRIKTIEAQKNTLIVSRNNEIDRIKKSRWESYAKNKFMVNRTEGIISINNSTYLFSSIKGAQINMVPGYRVVSTETSTTKSRKHASVGGAIVGGMIAGPVGAVVGGSALGKTKSKTQGRVVTNQIPTCMHLGVVVDLDGFSNEILLLTQQVDQSNSNFQRAYQEAQKIVAVLGALATTPVPQSFLQPEEEQSVKRLDAQIINKQQELETAVANVPTYALPAMYRTSEQSSMSDEEYLQYLREADSQRIAQIQAAKNNPKALKSIDNQTDVISNSSIDSTVSSIGRKDENKIINIVFWIVSSIFALTAVIMFIHPRGVVSGIIFLLTAILVNPLIGDLVYNKVIKFHRWIVAVILAIGFLAGVLAFALPKTTSGTASSETTIVATQEEDTSNTLTGIYYVMLKVECEENHLFDNYDVVVVFDDCEEGTIDYGASKTFARHANKGTRSIRFYLSGNESVYGECEIEITGPMAINCKISCNGDQFEIKELETHSLCDEISQYNTDTTTETEFDGVVDYPNVEDFEAAINAGEDVIGKTVTFTVLAYKPNGALGLNVWAGEHLNFISDTDPNVQEGDVITVRITGAKALDGTSWIITYTIIDR